MAPKFGTSGLRGLVTELTADCVGRYVQGFVTVCATGRGVFVGHDLRASSPALARTVAQAAQRAGVAVFDCGAVPTPALALSAMQAGCAAIMVTGSHIPADRNGLKFYTPTGEITKADEQKIVAGLPFDMTSRAGPAVTQDRQALAMYLQRYQTAYDGVLIGLRIGLYEQSAVGRDLLAALLTRLGADVVRLGRADTFVPVDTEALPETLRSLLRGWAQTHRLDAIVSTDADGDRPLLADQNGEVVAGDILGQITAQALGAQVVVTPVSSNTGVLLTGCFDRVIQTKIGSPFVIAAMQDAGGRVAGYEANGGFLLGFAAQGPRGPLPALMTRDALLPLLAVLARSRDSSVADVVRHQPARFTATDRVQHINGSQSAALLEALLADGPARRDILAPVSSAPCLIDKTDGVRMTLTNQRIIHFRASGNAPELRLYAEAETAQLAQDTLAQITGGVMRFLRGHL